MIYTDDPVRDFEEHDREEQEWLERRPICDICGEHIQDEHFYIIEGDYICPECLEGYKVRTEDYER